MKRLVALKSDKVGLLSLGIRSCVIVSMGGLKHNSKLFVTSSTERWNPLRGGSLCSFPQSETYYSYLDQKSTAKVIPYDLQV